MASGQSSVASELPEKLVALPQNLYVKSQLAVKLGLMLGNWFSAELGSRQGDLISPLSFITLLECVTESAKCSMECKDVNIHGLVIKDVGFADDVHLLAEEEAEL